MTIAWRIDALDARSGYAFTSRRVADLDSPSALADGIDTFFIEAPHFIPERVSSQAIAFGAARGSFQTGFYIQGEEVGFPQLSAVADFVRRAYGAGGTSDGNGGGGGTPPPPGPPDDRPREPFRFESGIDPVKLLIDAFESFNFEVKRAGRDTPNLIEDAFSGLSHAAAKAADGVVTSNRLARAAVTMALQILDFPPAQTDDEQGAIDSSGKALFGAISRLSLWSSIGAYLHADQAMFTTLKLSVDRYYELRAYVHDLYMEVRHATGRTGEQQAVVTLLYLSLRLGRGRDRDLTRTIYYFRHYGTLALNVAPMPPGQFADLSRIVVPLKLIPPPYRPARTLPSLRNLLVFTCSAPGKIESALREETLELVLFAACYLNASDVDRWEADNYLLDRYWPYDMTITMEEEISYTSLSALKFALPWIRRSLPHYAFASTIEEAIASTARQERQVDGPEPIIAL